MLFMPDYQVERWNQTDAPNERKLSRLMEREGYSVYQWSDRSGMTYSEHFHSTDQSHWIISGALELTIKDVGIYVLKAGDRDFMPANTYHSARVVSAEPVVYLIGEKL